MLPLGPQRYKREEIWLTIFLVDEETSAFFAVSERHNDELMESLESRKYQYAGGVMTVADAVSERFCAVRADDMLEHRGSDVFLKKNLR